MDRGDEAFDAAKFLELLDDSPRERLGHSDGPTGVLNARIHLRDGEPWAVSIELEAEEPAR